MITKHVLVLTKSFASFIFRALGQLVDHCLIAYASKYVKGVNAAGVRKIKRNILSLQQTLRGSRRPMNRVYLSGLQSSGTCTNKGQRWGSSQVG